MAMTAGDYAEQLVALLPSGPAWPNEGSQSSRMLSGLAAELARIDGRADALLDEVDPRTVTELIDEWELVSGTTGSTLGQRRAALHARMISLGGQSRAYFITLAGALGYTITIEELQPFRASKNRVGDVIAVPGVVYAWRVSVYGVASAPDLETLFRELKPAHTAVTFVYPAGSLAGAMSGSITVGTASLTGSIRLINARTDSFVPITARACTCGVFSLTADGIWTYVLDSHDPDAIALPAKATLAESVTVSASDGSLSGTVLITVVGIDDAGTIGGTDTGSTVEDVTTTCSGVLTVTDPDTGEAVFVAQTTSSAYGTFGLAKSGSWTYTLGAGAQALPGGATVSDTFTARSVGGASHVVSITITGSNDIATISGTGTGAIAAAAASVSGALSISDPDTGESYFAAATKVGTYGTLTITSAGAWTYVLDATNASVKTLGSGSTLTDQVTVWSQDLTASRPIVITITGQALTLDKMSVSAAAAYSLRRLRVGYAGAAIKVRRGSDSATQDIGFTSAGDLDTTSLLSFVGSGDGYVAAWYDQSGAGGNAAQSSTGLQPAIVKAGVTQTSGGKPAIRFDGSKTALALPSSVYALVKTLSLNCVANAPSTENRICVGWTSSAGQVTISSNGGAWFHISGASYVYSALQVSVPYVQTLAATNGAASAYYNGVLVSSFTGGSATSGTCGSIGRWEPYPLDYAWAGAISEIVIAASAWPDADRQRLERDQGSYYGVTVA